MRNAFYVLAVVLGLSGCKGKGGTATADAGGPSSSSSTTSAVGAGAKGAVDSGGPRSNDEEAAPEDVLLGRKMNPYIECSNKFTKGVRDARQWYFHSIDTKKGPNGKEGKVDIKEIDDPSACIASTAKMKTVKPSIPALETAAEAYGASVERLRPLHKDAHAYYAAENNKDDKGKKGRELHPQLLAEWKTFDDASQKLSAELEKAEDEVQGKRLARLKSDPSKALIFHHEEVLATAKGVVRVAVDAKRPEDLKLDAYTKSYEALEHSAVDYKSYLDAHKAEASKLGLDSFVSGSVDKFLATSKSLLRRKRDKEALSISDRTLMSGGHPENVEGYPQHVLRNYNEMIQAANRINWD